MTAMRMLIVWLCVSINVPAVLASPSPTDRGRVTVIHAGVLLARPGEPAAARQTILVVDGRIAAIRTGFLSAGEVAGKERPTEVIDLSDRFVLPGLIDLHVHLTTDAAEGEVMRVVTRDSADLAIVAAAHARETLDAGFTTVLDLGTARRAHNEAIYALRRSIERGDVAGPRLLVAGSPVSTTASSRTGRFVPGLDEAIGPDVTCDGPDDCALATRQQIAEGADVINMYNTGSIGDLHLVHQAMTDAEMIAVVSTAHALGRKVVADGHTASGINAALKAGADIVDTAPWLDAESLHLLERRGVFLEPHMHAFRVAVADMRSGSTTVNDEPDSPILARLKGVLGQPFCAERAFRAGIPLAYGSDTGIVQHGDNAGDFAELIGIGMSAMQAIQVATVNSAKALGLQGEIGSLEVGRSADIIATSGSPLEDLRQLQKVSFVMRDGHVFKMQ